MAKASYIKDLAYKNKLGSGCLILAAVWVTTGCGFWSARNQQIVNKDYVLLKLKPSGNDANVEAQVAVGIWAHGPTDLKLLRLFSSRPAALRFITPRLA